MADEPFLLVSLEEEKSKKLAQVLSNDTSRKILDFMSKREFTTESEVAKELKLPISTDHYNLDLLFKADLINGDQFNYSEKGKKIVHYALSNKYVIIAPKKTFMLFDKLKEFLPSLFISGAAALTLNYFFIKKSEFYAAPMLALEDSAGASLKSVAETAPQLAKEPNIALWFFLGCMFFFLTYLIISYFRKKKLA